MVARRHTAVTGAALVGVSAATAAATAATAVSMILWMLTATTIVGLVATTTGTDAFPTAARRATGTIARRTTTRGHPFSLEETTARRSGTTRCFTVATAVSNVNGDSTDSSQSSSPSPSAAASAVSAASASPSCNIRLNVNEKARTVTSVCTSGTLCTKSIHPGMEGAPFGSFVDYVLDDAGNPILLMNDMSMHTLNVQKGSSTVTLFTQLSQAKAITATAASTDTNAGQDVSRCSLTGTLTKIPETDPERDAIRMRYSIAHTYADQVMDSPKFAFYRLTPQHIYFVGGFGVLAKWVEPTDYHAAAPDILARTAASIVARINRDHGDDLHNTARHLLEITAPIEGIRMTSVDRLGLDIRVTFLQGSRRNKLQTDEFRIGFRIPVQSVEDAKSEILKVFQEAWEKGNGMSWGEAMDTAPGSTVPIVKIAADSLE